MTADAILSLQPGALFGGRYRIVRRIKAGGMGAVYEAVDERTDSPRALKVMLPSMLADKDLPARFALEIAAQPGTGTWAPTATPAAMSQGPAQVAVTRAGTESVIVAACYNAGLWRYVEP